MKFKDATHYFNPYLCTIRTISSILFLFIVLVQMAGKWLVLADYAWNKEFIARTLCVNKAKPMMNCKGKCHLRKQLQNEENGGAGQSNRSGQHKFQEVFFEVTAYTAPEAAITAGAINTTTNTTLYTSRYISSVFHPPGA